MSVAIASAISTATATAALKSFNPGKLEKFLYAKWNIAKTFPILSFWVLIAAPFEAYQKLFAEEPELIISIFLKWDTSQRYHHLR